MGGRNTWERAGIDGREEQVGESTSEEDVLEEA